MNWEVVPDKPMVVDIILMPGRDFLLLMVPLHIVFHNDHEGRYWAEQANAGSEVFGLFWYRKDINQWKKTHLLRIGDAIDPYIMDQQDQQMFEVARVKYLEATQ